MTDSGAMGRKNLPSFILGAIPTILPPLWYVPPRVCRNVPCTVPRRGQVRPASTTISFAQGEVNEHDTPVSALLQFSSSSWAPGRSLTDQAAWRRSGTPSTLWTIRFIGRGLPDVNVLPIVARIATSSGAAQGSSYTAGAFGDAAARGTMLPPGA